MNPFPAVEFGDFYAAELFDPVLERRLFVHYEVDVIDWAKNVTVH